MTDTGPVLHPSRTDLDDLELVRRGLYGPDARIRPLPVTPDLLTLVAGSGSLTVVDPEGVPLVRLEDVTVSDGSTPAATGRPVWLAEPSSRPFAALHPRAPRDLSSHRVVVVERVADLPDHVDRHDVLLVLASTALDGPSTGTDLVRAAVTVAEPLGAEVLVVPLPPDDADRRSAFFATAGIPDPSAGAPTRPSGSPSASVATNDRGAGPTADLGARRCGLVVLLTGLSGSGKSTVARAVATRLVEDGVPVTLLDGDVVRRHLTAGLGFSPADRRTNVLRIGWVAAEIAHHGGVAICSPIAPEDAVREQVRALVDNRGGRFALVHVATPLAECERRDRKGLYAAARRGDIPDFTGISAPYDVPADPDLRIDTTGRDVAECADLVLGLVRERAGVDLG